MALFSAAKDESLANAALEWQLAKTNADATKLAADNATASVDDLMSKLEEFDEDYDFNAWKADAQTTSTQLQTLNTTATAARNTRLNTNNQQLTTTKTSNANTRKASENTAHQTLQQDNNVANANYAIGSFGAMTTYLTSMKTIKTNYENAINTAHGTYISTEAIAWNNYAKKVNRLDEAYGSAIDQLNSNPNFHAAAYVTQVVAAQSNGGTGNEVQPNGGVAKSGYGVNRASQNYASQGDPKPPASGPNPKANGILRGIVNFFGGSGQGNSQTYKDAQSHGALSGEHPYNTIGQFYHVQDYPTTPTKTIFPDIKTPNRPGKLKYADKWEEKDIEDKERKVIDELLKIGFDVISNGKGEAWDFEINGIKWQLKQLTADSIKTVFQRIKQGGEKCSHVIVDLRESSINIDELTKRMLTYEFDLHNLKLQEIRIITNNSVRVWVPK